MTFSSIIFWLCCFLSLQITYVYFFYVQSLRKGPLQQEKKTNAKKKTKNHQPRWKKLSSDEDDDDDDKSSSSSSSSEEDVVIKRHKKSAHSDSDSDIEDEEELMDRLPENPKPLLDFAGASQGILLLLVLKQHLKNLYGFSDRYSTLKTPTEVNLFLHLYEFIVLICVTAKYRNIHPLNLPKCTIRM